MSCNSIYVTWRQGRIWIPALHQHIPYTYCRSHPRAQDETGQQPAGRRSYEVLTYAVEFKEDSSYMLAVTKFESADSGAGVARVSYSLIPSCQIKSGRVATITAAMTRTMLHLLSRMDFAFGFTDVIFTTTRYRQTQRFGYNFPTLRFVMTPMRLNLAADKIKWIDVTKKKKTILVAICTA